MVFRLGGVLPSSQPYLNSTFQYTRLTTKKLNVQPIKTKETGQEEVDPTAVLEEVLRCFTKVETRI